MMTTGTRIEWTEETINPLIGCSKISPGCDHCYAERQAKRLKAMKVRGYADVVNEDGWTGRTAFVESELEKLVRWRKPRNVFVGSMTDIFHESVPDAVIDDIFAVMAIAGNNNYQILTKRPKNALRHMKRHAEMWENTLFSSNMLRLSRRFNDPKWHEKETREWPLKNVWFGVTAENQEQADKRIPYLLSIPAEVRFISIEPMLGPIDISWVWRNTKHQDTVTDWVIVGGESGPGARPMHPEWVRSIRDQCKAGRVPFFFKQWGEYVPQVQNPEALTERTADKALYVDLDGETRTASRGARGKAATVQKVGKKAAGRKLDGKIHDAMPGGER